MWTVWLHSALVTLVDLYSCVTRVHVSLRCEATFQTTYRPETTSGGTGQAHPEPCSAEEPESSCNIRVPVVTLFQRTHRTEVRRLGLFTTTERPKAKFVATTCDQLQRCGPPLSAGGPSPAVPSSTCSILAPVPATPTEACTGPYHLRAAAVKGLGAPGAHHPSSSVGPADGLVSVGYMSASSSQLLAHMTPRCS